MKDVVLQEAKSDLLDLIKKRSEISVEDGSEALGLAKTTIRQHLSKLVSMGFVDTRSHRHGRGRPRKMYSLTEKSEVFFEQRENEFLMRFLQYLYDEGRDEVVREFIVEMGHELRDGLDVSDAEISERISALEALARRQGFMAQTVDNDDHTILEFRNCPFFKVAKITDFFCKIEHQHVEEILGIPVERIRHRLNGDQTCAYCIKSDGD